MNHRVAHLVTTLEPTLTRATLVPLSRAVTPSQNSEYGNAHGRSGRVASRTPMPGTITTSWRRTHAQVRKGSSSLPRTLRALARAPVAVPAWGSYHCKAVAGA